VSVHYALGERANYVGRSGRKTWPTTDADAVAAARARGDEQVPRMAGGYTFADMVAKYNTAVADLAALDAEEAPLNAGFVRRGRWSRFFVVQQNNGHIHSSMACSTCNRNGSATSFGWNPELSGLTEAEAVAKLGPSLCTVCFPSAPVEWTVGKRAADHCIGSDKRPMGDTKRVGMSRYGKCTQCKAMPVVKAGGLLKKHKPEN
jgi:hypothetical protein